MKVGSREGGALMGGELGMDGGLAVSAFMFMGGGRMVFIVWVSR